MGAEEAHYPVWDMEYRILVVFRRNVFSVLVVWQMMRYCYILERA